MPGDDTLDAFEALAAEFARIAGAEIEASLKRVVAVQYKDGNPDKAFDPVSEVDRHVETIVRERIAETHPDHQVIGEEFGADRGHGDGVVWAIDPVDGTANFVNGIPLYSASIGVLYRGVPVAGAVWCTATRRLGPGVYSARHGGRLSLDGTPVETTPNPGVKRRMVGLPRAIKAVSGFDGRTLGSSAIECAFVAAGLLAGARFETPSVWDVAGGVPLVRAAGGTARVKDGDGVWQPLGDFYALSGRDNAALAAWSGTVAVGSEDAVAALTEYG